MKLHLTQASDKKLITGYSYEQTTILASQASHNWVEVNKKRFEQSLIVLPDAIISDWPVPDFASLKAEHFEAIAQLSTAQLKLEVVLLGTGYSHQFAHPRLSRALMEAGISVEYMSTDAACRTYNFLMAEGRQVAAALIIECF